MSEVFANGASSSLSSDITSSALSLTVASGSAFSTPAAGEQGRLVLDNEIIIFTGRSGNVLSWPSTAYRGAEGTSAASHTAGATVTQELTAGALAALGGGPTRIQRITPTGTNADFTSIPATFKHLEIKWQAKGTDAAAQLLLMQFNADTGNNYDWLHSFTHVGGVLVDDTATTGTPSAIPIGYAVKTAGSYADQGIVRINAYASTSFYHSSESDSSYIDAASSGGMYRHQSAGWWKNTAAINEIKITLAAGNFASGSVFDLWGYP